MNEERQVLENSEQQSSKRAVNSNSPQVHITQYNLERILMNQCHLSALEGIDEEIWKSRLDIFNRLEVNQLCEARSALYYGCSVFKVFVR